MARKLTPADAAELLALAAAFDRRTIAEEDAVAWADALYDLEREDCAAAVRLHYRESTVFIMPAHVRQRVSYLRNARADRAHDLELRREIQAGNDIDRNRVRALALDTIRRVEQQLGEETTSDEQHSAIRIRCPYCRAQPGRACFNVATEQERRQPHPSRLEAFL